MGFAKLQMLKELNFSETVYGLGASMFFVGYVLLEVPSNVIMLRVGARLWIVRIMISWGMLSGAMIFVNSAWLFYVPRLLLGLAEAGFIPGILLYLTYWFPASRRGKITAFFLAAIPMATIIGGRLSGWILREVSGARGLSGWQWQIAIETIPSLLLGSATIVYLRDRVIDVKWHDTAEKRVIARAVAAEEGEKEGHPHLGAAFSDRRVWLLSVIYFTIVCGIYIISFWLPSLIKQAGVSDTLTIGLLTAVPYVVAIVATIAFNVSEDRLRERRSHTLLPALVCGVGLALTAFAGTSLGLDGRADAGCGGRIDRAGRVLVPAPRHSLAAPRRRASR